MSSTTNSTSGSLAQRVTIRKSEERGHANHGWLDSYHTFSFASYHDPRFAGYSSLRVINEDRVSGGRGFGAHPHSNAEIFSYVVSGSLEHRDTLTNQEVIERGGVQFTSAGSGVMHSEYNHSATEPVHFLQVWLKPDQRGLKPGYQTADFTDEEKHGKLCLIVSSKYHTGDGNTNTTTATTATATTAGEGKGPVIVNQNVQVFASMLAKDEAVTYDYGQERCGYLHVCQTGGRLRLRLVGDDAESAAVRDDEEVVVLEGGDGVFIRPGTRLQIIGANDDNKRAEFLLFDLAKEE